jgi:outer membrane murein-binding lipoprotein Lpp
MGDMDGPVCSKCGGVDFYVTPSNGWRRCVACHRERNQRYAVEKKLETLPVKIDELRAELDRLRQQYAADPKNWALGTEAARAEQRWRHYATAEKREAEMQAGRVAAAAADAKRRAYRVPDQREWAALVPAACPGCGGVTRHFAQRVAELGWRHRQSGCDYESKIDWSPNG